MGWLAKSFASLCYALSGVAMLLFLWCVTDAQKFAEDNQKEKTLLLNRVGYVEEYLREYGSLPTQERFEEASIKMEDHARYSYRIHANQPSNDDGFVFSTWPSGEKCFAVSYWRGEWSEFYDSNTGQSSLDETEMTAFWIKDSLGFLWIALALGTLPLVSKWTRKKLQNCTAV